LILRNETVDALRAFAALGVCLFHFTFGTQHFADVSVLHQAGGYGALGVVVFFTISGFIVPHAMARANYEISLWPRFMAKRLIRLEPPYLVSIMIVMLLGLLSTFVPGFRGGAIDWSMTQVAAHLGYMNAFVGLPWLNPVYWSLAIEFQFYLLIGLLFPLLSGGTPITRLIVVGCMVCAPWIFSTEGDWLITRKLPVFAAGILTFLYASHLVPKKAFWLGLGAIGASIAWRSDAAIALAAVIPAIAIATLRIPHIPCIARLGAISYSLYLLHVPIGGRIVNLSTRLPPSIALEIVVVTAAFAASIASAYALYRLVEKPAVHVAASVPYRAGVTTARVTSGK
jgi:peptidoglycan/LPS O-acetylase OafA/YrhL